MIRSKKTSARCARLAVTIRHALIGSFICLGQTHAASFDFEEVTIDIDSTLTYGLQWRVESRDDSISVGRPGTNNGIDSFPAVVDNAFILNGNDGNISFDKGDLTANRLSILSELSISAGDFGLFVRGKAYYDNVYAANSTNISEANYASFNAKPMFHVYGGNTSKIGQFNPEAVEYMEMDARLLDYFVYGSFPIGEKDISFKLGRQVMSWGEGLFSGGGLTTSVNRIDAQIRSTPGLDLKELFLPTAALSLSFDISDTWSFEGYYQFEWDASVMDPNSTFMQEFDSIGAGGDTFMFLSGYSHAIPNGQLAGGTPTPTSYEEVSKTLKEKRILGLELTDKDQLDILQKFIPRPGCDDKFCATLVSRLVEVKPARDQGQFGLSFKHFLDNGDELALYFVNYHERIPNFVLPLDSANDYAALINLLVSLPVLGDPANVKKLNENGEEVDIYQDISDLSANLNYQQYSTLLNFFSSLPEKGGTLAEITSNFAEAILPGLTLSPLARNALSDFLTNLGSITDAQINNIVGITSFIAPTLAPTIRSNLEAVQGLDGNAYIRSLNYRIHYAEDVRAWATTYSTVVGDTNIAAELIYKENMPLLSGNVARTPRRGEFYQLMVNSIFVFEPTALWDFSSFTAEIATWYLPGKKEFDPDDYDNPDRVAVQNTPNGFGYGFLWTLEWRSVTEGLDLMMPIYISHGVEGAMFTSGYRDGQISAAIGLSAKYLQSLEVSASYFANLGEKDDPFQTMIHDRDNFSIAVKYAF